MQMMVIKSGTVVKEEIILTRQVAFRSDYMVITLVYRKVMGNVVCVCVWK